MDDRRKSEDLDEYWATRIIPANEADGYIAEVYHQMAMTFEVTDSALESIEGAWLRENVYRSLTVYPSIEQAREAAERLRLFFDFAHLRG